MKAMILAAGLGTRLKPLTDEIPKALLKVGSQTLLEILIKKLKSQNFDDIIINVHHFAERITSYLKEHESFGASITISDESDKLLDTGGGLKRASGFFNDSEPFLVHNVDVMSDLNLVELKDSHTAADAIATLVVMKRKSNRYFIFENGKNLCGWGNSVTGEEILIKNTKGKLVSLAFSGIQILDPKIFNYFPDENVFSLVDLYLQTAAEKKISAFIYEQGKWIDVGRPENLKEAVNII
jgi:NDP-sugar pyrophosphorylase family protein